MKTYETIQTEVEEGILTVTLNNPQTLNALSVAMRGELIALLREVSKDHSIKVVVLTGAGRAFCSGGDIGTMSKYKLNQGRQRMKDAHQLTKLLMTMDQPVIAAINGPCMGAGLSMIMACDYAVASENAKFCLSFIKIGLAPDMGGGFLLTHLVGARKAKELAMLAETFKAPQALEYGLINKVVPEGEALSAAYEIAKVFAHGPGLAYAMTKALINKSSQTSLDQYLEFEANAQDMLMMSEDFYEGITSFKEKRPAIFKGE